MSSVINQHQSSGHTGREHDQRAAILTDGPVADHTVPTMDTTANNTTDVTISSSRSTITLTPAAQARVRALLDAEVGGDTHGAAELALRISVRSGGCSGFSYEMYFDADEHSDDERVTCGSVSVLVDAASRPLLTGATLDYVDTLNESGFKVTNPNATRSCGCGKSFGA